METQLGGFREREPLDTFMDANNIRQGVVDYTRMKRFHNKPSSPILRPGSLQVRCFADPW